MKIRLLAGMGLSLASLLLGFGANAAETTNTAAARIGVYDSRAIAYAYFWSASYQQQLGQWVAEARAIKSAGDTNRYQILEVAMQERQAENHRQVFSTAPVNAALATLKDKLPGFQKRHAIVALVSKWDAPALRVHAQARQVDVTDDLVREFLTPTENQSKTIESLRNAKPVPLEKCNELIRSGKL